MKKSSANFICYQLDQKHGFDRIFDYFIWERDIVVNLQIKEILSKEVRDKEIK